ncbi:Crp/Fnr family transcriptional regulator [Roseicyclus sp.]|jgi:CRP/FNR family transcriptional regulator, anaerobic regulatory protein|uniref:Crp/Fnr family transcriptional regulator n=1 Tax=Roseicyclus sp. TaxID=1914329 RepID=UPI003F69C93A
MAILQNSQSTPNACAGCDPRTRALCKAVSGASIGRAGIRLRKLPAGWVLQDEGEAPKLTGILRRGYLRTERILEDGRRSIVGLALPSDPIGAWLEQDGNCSISAATDIEICSFDPQILRRLFEKEPALRREILRAAAEQYARQLELLWRRGALNSRERIIAFLVMAAEIMPSEPLPDGGLVVSVPISRRDWADMTNTTVETICRTLGQLAEQGLIESRAQGRYRINNLTALADLAGIDPEMDVMAVCRTETTAQDDGRDPAIRDLPGGARGPYLPADRAAAQLARASMPPRHFPI